MIDIHKLINETMKIKEDDDVVVAEVPTEDVPATVQKETFTVEEAQKVADELGITFDSFTIEEFRQGLDIELEHGSKNPDTNITNDDPIMTAKITLAHLKEIADYNTRLLAMEEEAKAEKTTEPEVAPPAEEPEEIQPVEEPAEPMESKKISA